MAKGPALPTLRQIGAWRQAATDPPARPRRTTPAKVRTGTRPSIRFGWALAKTYALATYRLSAPFRISGYHPGRPCNEEGQAEFGPVRMRFRVSDQARHPNQQTKERQHEGHQTHRKPRVSIDENGNRRECKCDRREDRPKALIWRNPLGNQARCHREIEYLTQRK